MLIRGDPPTRRPACNWTHPMKRETVMRIRKGIIIVLIGVPACFLVGWLLVNGFWFCVLSGMFPAN